VSAWRNPPRALATSRSSPDNGILVHARASARESAREFMALSALTTHYSLMVSNRRPDREQQPGPTTPRSAKEHQPSPAHSPSQQLPSTLCLLQEARRALGRMVGAYRPADGLGVQQRSTATAPRQDEPRRTLTDMRCEVRTASRQRVRSTPVDGIQKVRGSNPLSSTFFRVLVR
jgi:hypothetical protein